MLSENWTDKYTTDWFNTVELEKLKYKMKLIFPIPTIRLSQLEETILIAIDGYVWADHVDTKEVTYPVDWWQAFKDRWFPQWAKKRWPIKYNDYAIEKWLTYPGIDYRVPDQETRLVVHVVDLGNKR